MLPAIVQRRVEHAQAVATGLRDTSVYCRADQQALCARLLQASQTIDELVALLQSSQFVAKLNHDTILARNAL